MCPSVKGVSYAAEFKCSECGKAYSDQAAYWGHIGGHARKVKEIPKRGGVKRTVITITIEEYDAED